MVSWVQEAYFGVEILEQNEALTSEIVKKSMKEPVEPVLAALQPSQIPDNNLTNPVPANLPIMVYLLMFLLVPRQQQQLLVHK